MIFKDRIPAFAGMSGWVKKPPFQLTSPPSAPMRLALRTGGADAAVAIAYRMGR